MRRRNLRVALLQFHARDNQLAFVFVKPLERRLVPFDGLLPDRFVEWRRRRIRMLRFVVDPGRRGISRDTADLVADPIDQGLPKIRLERAVVPRLERV